MAIANTFVAVLLKQALNLLVGSLWKTMEKIVIVYSDSSLSDEDKKNAAIGAFREQLLIAGKELSNSMVNFLLEATVLLLKLKK